jgi:predicted nucleotidyltransferase
MSNTYEGWSNIETFMVASIIDNDRAFLDFILSEVSNYIVNNMEHELPSRLKYVTRANVKGRVPNAELEAKDYLLVMLRLRSELHHVVLKAFFEEVDWDELAEHYKAKYVENLINDKDVLDEIAKGKESKYHSEPDLNPMIPIESKILNPAFKDPIMDIMQSIDDMKTDS